ncbi:MAG: TrkA family potassium uptake protein [Acidimicrobiia bacterium]|nr:MAG: TrkA family potassium uptake protein [Acidimicrobiia bacterium]
MLVVIAGCGRVGSYLAITLSEEGHDVSVIDEELENLSRLGATFNGKTEVGLAYDVRTLRSADIEFADAFVAVTSNDNANVMAAQVAKEVFGVPRTIARLDDPARAEVYRALNVRYVAGAHLVARVVHEQIVEPEFDYHVTFSTGDIEIVEMHMGDAADGVKVSDFEIRDSLRVAAIMRDGRSFIPGPDTLLREGDLVVGSAKHGITGKVSKYLVDIEPELA